MIRKLSILLSCLLVPIMIMGQGYFTIIDDDISSVETVTSVKNVADKYGVKITYAATVSRLEKNQRLTETLLQFQKEGHQIVDHGWTHSLDVWGQPKWEVIEKELDKSSRLLDSLGFHNHDYLVYPFGKYSIGTRNKITPHVARRYKMAFDARGHFCDLSDFNRFYIPRFAVRWHNNMWAVKYWIKKASKADNWVVFLNHSGKSNDYKEEHLSEIIVYCQELGMKNLTVKEAYQKFGKLKADKHVKNYTVWDEITDVLFLHVVWLLVAFLIIVLVGICIYMRLKH